MTSKLAYTLAALPWMIGCDAGGPGQHTGDSAPPELGPMSLATTDEVLVAEGLGFVPFVQFWFVVWIPLAIEGDCPAYEAVGEYGYVVTGGCTSASGDVWLGAVSFSATETELRADLDGWGLEGQFVGDGALILSVGEETAPLVTEGFSITMPVPSAHTDSGSITASYADFASAVPTVDGAVDMTADMEIAGAVRVAELGDLTVEGVVGQSVVCDSEHDSGHFTFLGDGQASVAYDGATACDGCYTATTSDGVAHQVCPE